MKLDLVELDLVKLDVMNTAMQNHKTACSLELWGHYCLWWGVQADSDLGTLS